MRRALLLSVVLPFMAGVTTATAQTPPATQTAQETPTSLIADTVFITPDRQLVATGHVEIFQGNTRLTAEKITFDDTAGTLRIEGPIRIDQGEDVTILADAAELDSALRNGILTSARLVFQQQVQLASLQMTRVGGRYTQLYKTAVTSCDVCDDGRPPLWQIRAERVTHDSEERQLYLEGAQLRIRNVPVFYFPGLRLPDPTLERATGFLVPSLRTSSTLGTGVIVPYFFKLSDHKDLTLAPYLSSRTQTLNARYRQAFRRGTIEFNGAITRDDLEPGEGRGYLFGDGAFSLNNNFDLSFEVRSVSDDAYLADYSLPDLDRLRSQIALSNVRRDKLLWASATHYKTLRDTEQQDLIPSAIFDIYYEQRFHPENLDGELRLSVDAHSHRRTSKTLGTMTDTNGRDVGRLTFDLDWRQDWHLRNGLIAEWQAGIAADQFALSDDTAYDGSPSRLTPRTALTFRLPMSRHSGTGVSQYLEPIVQLGWTDVSGDDAPNEESNSVEFDQGNLLSLSRFPAEDAREDGLSLVYGVNWSRYSASGWQAAASLGQILRAEAEPQFDSSTGLSGTTSDFLVAGQLKLNKGLALSARGLLNQSLSLTKAEVRGNWQHDKANLSGTYLWLDSVPTSTGASDTSELWFDGNYDLSPNWTASANLRYDVSDERATRAGVGFVYRNECVTVDLSINRRYTSTTSVEPSTDFGFTISLNGFSVDSGSNKYRRSCSNT